MIKAAVFNLQKKVDARLDSAKASVQKCDASITSVRSSMDHLAQECATEFQTLESKINQMQESLSEINTDIKRTRSSITEIEKSLTKLSEKDEFTIPTKTVKERTSEVECKTETENKFTELEVEFDHEVVFKGAEPGQRNCFKSVSTQVSDGLPEKDTPEKSVNTTNNTNYTIKSYEGNDDSDKSKTYTRKENLIGDSISGQVNPAMLGKSTKTYVKRLKAPKIEDLHTLTDR